MQVTSMTGVIYNFNPEKVVEVTGPHETDMDTRLYLYGIAMTPVAISGDAAAFVTSMPNVKSFAPLTFAKTNKIFWTNASYITAVHDEPSDVAAKFPFAKAGVLIGRGKHPRYVSESVADARIVINNAGGNV